MMVARDPSLSKREKTICSLLKVRFCNVDGQGPARVMVHHKLGEGGGKVGWGKAKKTHIA